jgi:hypothetical protein
MARCHDAIQFLDKSRIREYIFLQKKTLGPRKSGPEKGEASLRDGVAHNLRREFSPAAIFLFFPP